MSDHELFNFLELHNIVTYGLRGRRVTIKEGKVYWKKRSGKLVEIEDWSAALELGGHDTTKTALIQMGAQVHDADAKEAVK